MLPEYLRYFTSIILVVYFKENFELINLFQCFVIILPFLFLIIQKKIFPVDIWY